MGGGHVACLLDSESPTTPRCRTTRGATCIQVSIRGEQLANEQLAVASSRTTSGGTGTAVLQRLRAAAADPPRLRGGGPRLRSAALASRPLEVHDDGEQTRDLTSTASVTEVLVNAVRRGVTAEVPVNLGFGRRRWANEAFRELADVLGGQSEMVCTEPRLGDVGDSQADNRRLRVLFPDAAPVRFRDGLKPPSNGSGPARSAIRRAVNPFSADRPTSFVSLVQATARRHVLEQSSGDRLP